MTDDLLAAGAALLVITGGLYVYVSLMLRDLARSGISPETFLAFLRRPAGR